MLKPGDEDDLVRAGERPRDRTCERQRVQNVYRRVYAPVIGAAEAEMQESGRVGWRQLMRRVKLVTEKSPSSVEGEDGQGGMPTAPSSSSSLE